MCTIASVLPCSRAAHISQCEGGQGEASLGPLALVLGEVSSPHLVQSKSVIVDVRATLQDEVLSRVQDMALVSQERGLHGQTWREGDRRVIEELDIFFNQTPIPSHPALNTSLPLPGVLLWLRAQDLHLVILYPQLPRGVELGQTV